MTCAAKNSEARCYIAQQPMWRYVNSRHRSCIDMFCCQWKQKIIYFFLISSETPRFTTARVAVFDVSPYGLLRHAKYRCSFSAGQSSCAIIDMLLPSFLLFLAQVILCPRFRHGPRNIVLIGPSTVPLHISLQLKVAQHVANIM